MLSMMRENSCKRLAFGASCANYMHDLCMNGGIDAMNGSLDSFDLKLLRELQKDARLTNNELAERVALSASQCSRRRARLEADGYIEGYQAVLDRAKLGFDLLVVISVTLAKHNQDGARRFARLVNDLPEVIEAYSLTGDMDYHLKVAVRGLGDLSRFINNVLLPHDSVQHVRTSIVLDVLKRDRGLSLPTV